MPIEDFIIYVYCCVVEKYIEITKSTVLRTRGYEPKLTDSEMIRMEIVGEFMGKSQDKSIWEYFHQHWRSWFPNLGSRANFAKQSANLCLVKERILRELSMEIRGYAAQIYLADGFPIPVCKRTRARQSSCFCGEATYGYGAAKDEKYYGFKGHIVINVEGVICGYTFAPANVDERDVLQDITEALNHSKGSLLIADKGYIRPSLTQELARQGIDLQTPLRNNMHDTRPKTWVKQLMSTRRRIETVIGQLVERFQIQMVHARDIWHLTNRFVRKLLAHTVGVFLNLGVTQLNLEYI